MEEEYSGKILDILPVGIAIHTIGHEIHFKYFNEYYLKLLKITREVLQKPNEVWENLFEDPVLREQMKTRIFEDFGSENPERMFWDFIPVTRQGSETTYISAKSVRIPGKDLVVTLIWDVTELKETEDLLRKNKIKLSDAMDLAKLANWEYDVESNNFVFDDRFYSLFGTTREREGEKMTAEQYAESFIPPEERYLVAEESRKAFETKDPDYVSQVEHRIIRRDGEIRYLSVYIRAFKDESGKTVKTWGVNQDITERKMAEEALSVINNKLNMLSSITRHDILNTIMAVRGYIELSEDFIDNPEMRKYIEKEKEAVNAIQHQIEFTRQYQDIGVNEPGWQDAGEIADLAAKNLDLKEIKFQNSIRGVEIYSDPLVEKVFYNLMENTLRHGEHVTEISLSYSADGDTLVISYRDNGVGIAAESREKLFQKGFGKHTGLGLFLSREILSITGISITENGKEGEGVDFEITVPKGSYRFATLT